MCVYALVNVLFYTILYVSKQLIVSFKATKYIIVQVQALPQCTVAEVFVTCALS